MPFETEFKIAWGDCDPAGIVFYPRYFYWFDTTYQRWLQANDLSQAILQARYGIVGTGVIDTAAAFRTPSRDGDSITVRASVTDWQERSFRVDYECRREDRTIAIGHETRGWFEITDQRIRRGTIPDEFRLALS
ncbi:MAG: acyl-CoA thioesterase [Hyphomicrobiaceae bacterium]